MPKIKFEITIVLVYLLIGSLWILFSDMILYYFISDIHLLSKFQTYKGWFYVFVTAVLFYFLLKRHLIKLRKAEREAKESERIKTAFLQNISHEIRTPMNGIIGFAELLNSPELKNDQKKEFTRIIINSSKQLLSVIDDIMAASMLETGEIKINDNVFNLNILMNEVFQVFNPLISKNITFEVRNGLPDNESEIISDRIKLRQIIFNLVDNAKKFTEQGHIYFGYVLKKNELEFYTEDSGPGISPEQHEIIFNRFSKLGFNTKKLYDGVGLGLAICKGNVEILGGKIWLKSTINNGSTFYFTIPYKSRKISNIQ